MVSSLEKVLIKHPRDAYINQTKLNAESAKLNYLQTPNFEKACLSYDSFIDVLKNFNCELHYLPVDEEASIDSIYTHDPCIISNNGAIFCRMGKKDRFKEPKLMENYLNSIGIPTLGRIKYPGILEGGDVVWIKERVLAVGEGYRSNIEGINQLTSILGDLVDKVIIVPLPHWTGQNDCLHLMSNLSPIDNDLFLVYSRLLPVSFRQFLINEKIQLIEVPDSEYLSMGCNVLALAPRKVLMLEGNPITEKRLKQNRVEVITYDGSEISLKGSGGPTCLTRPFLRSN